MAHVYQGTLGNSNLVANLKRDSSTANSIKWRRWLFVEVDFYTKSSLQHIDKHINFYFVSFDK